MPSVQTLRKIALRIITFAFLAAVSDVTVFHRSAAADFLRAHIGPLASHGFFEPAAAVIMGFALLALLVGLRRLGHNLTSFARYLWGVSDEVTAEKDLRANRIQVITMIVQAVGGFAVLVGIYFAWANLKDMQKNQTDTLRVTTEGQITDRFTKAIDQLGATDSQGQPRLELRLGGIYALERIARESEEDHWPIMEVLTTYVRMHAPVQQTQDQQLYSNCKNPRTNNAVRPAVVPINALTPDIQAILTVIGRRESRFEQGKPEIIDLSNTNLAKAYLARAHLFGAELSGAHLFGADLSGAELSGADLVGARLTAIPSHGVYDAVV